MFLSSDFFKATLAFTFLIVFTVTLLRTDNWWKALAYPFLAVMYVYLATSFIWIASDILAVIFRT